MQDQAAISPSDPRTGPVPPGSSPSASEIGNWLVLHLAARLDVNPTDMDTNASFDSLGIDSVIAIALSGELAEWLRRDVDPTMIYDYPTISELARHLAGVEPQASGQAGL